MHHLMADLAALPHPVAERYKRCRAHATIDNLPDSGYLSVSMMRLIKPPRLRRGDVIGICAPASPPTPAEDVGKGIQYLERLGYRVEVGRNVFKRHGYLAGTDRGRADDLNTFFSNPGIRAIFIARGGYGAHRILPLLDYSLIRRNPKILVGYSDITAIQFAILAKAGVITFSGPMVAADMSGGLSGAAEELFWRWMTSPAAPPPVTGEQLFTSRAGTRTSAEGRLIGGNLSLISALLGTEYFPSLYRPVYLLEEIGERPYRIDRMLTHMKIAGVLDRAAGVAFGRFIDCRPEQGKPSLSLEQIIQNTFHGSRYPVIPGFQYGHCRGSISFPQGVRVRCEARPMKLRFLEGGVR